LGWVCRGGGFIVVVFFFLAASVAGETMDVKGKFLCDGQPIAGMTVKIDDAAVETGFRNKLSTLTNGEGYFEMEDEGEVSAGEGYEPFLSFETECGMEAGKTKADGCIRKVRIDLEYKMQEDSKEWYDLGSVDLKTETFPKGESKFYIFDKTECDDANAWLFF